MQRWFWEHFVQTVRNPGCYKYSITQDIWDRRSGFLVVFRNIAIPGTGWWDSTRGTVLRVTF